MIESNDSFGPIEFDYYPIGAGSDWFTKWMPGYPAPRQGYKIHISARAEDAEIVARSVLPHLRRLRVAHKCRAESGRLPSPVDHRAARQIHYGLHSKCGPCSENLGQP